MICPTCGRAGREFAGPPPQPSPLLKHLDKVRRFQFGRLAVEWRSKENGGRWAIVLTGTVYNRQNKFEFESLPSERTDAFKERTRWSLEEALSIAEKLLASDPYYAEDE